MSHKLRAGAVKRVLEIYFFFAAPGQFKYHGKAEEMLVESAGKTNPNRESEGVRFGEENQL